MINRTRPAFRILEEISLIGTTAIYDSQAEASRLIPQQWREFRRSHPELGPGAKFVGASPCTDDGKIHYLTGVEQEGGGEINGRRLTLEAGDYAVVHVDDSASLRDTWIWLLSVWLPESGREERPAPEFERFSGVSEEGLPVGSVEVWTFRLSRSRKIESALPGYGEARD